MENEFYKKKYGTIKKNIFSAKMKTEGLVQKLFFNIYNKNYGRKDVPEVQQSFTKKILGLISSSN